jgi:hypothetical protein
MRKNGANLCQQNCDPLNLDNDFTLGVESQRSHFADFAPHRNRSCVGNRARRSHGSGLPRLF